MCGYLLFSAVSFSFLCTWFSPERVESLKHHECQLWAFLLEADMAAPKGKHVSGLCGAKS